ncbi:MAG: hypothetical protein FOGNACKC_02230 [Anaerolineae bacterium]|nr:hypothetical protein [Anaerolineae bacterium]
MSVHEVAEGEQEIRRGEGIVFQLTTTNWESAPTPANISIIRLKDGQDVTSQFTSTATPNVTGDVITLPKITAPGNAATGRYRVNMPFTAGGFVPGVPYVDLIVKAG